MNKYRNSGTDMNLGGRIFYQGTVGESVKTLVIFRSKNGLLND